MVTRERVREPANVGDREDVYAELVIWGWTMEMSMIDGAFSTKFKDV